MKPYPDQIIVSMQIGVTPRRFGNRVIVSASDSAWDAVDDLPDELKKYLTDDIGNSNPSYGGFLFPKNIEIIDIICQLEYFISFRGVSIVDIKKTSCVKRSAVNSLGKKLNLVGWDIVSGNGWVSASCTGLFPIDPFNGIVIDELTSVNEYGLFAKYNECLDYVGKNNIEIPGNSPWYPVSVYLDDCTLCKLHALRNQSPVGQTQAPVQQRLED